MVNLHDVYSVWFWAIKPQYKKQYKKAIYHWWNDTLAQQWNGNSTKMSSKYRLVHKMIQPKPEKQQEHFTNQH